MAEFKDKIRAAGGKVEFLYDPNKGIATQISGTGFMELYQIAISMDGRRLLATVPATGIGQGVVYPQPSIIAFIQSDQLGMWGRNCPACEKYFRTNHIMGLTSCPYCSIADDSLAFVSKDQHKYVRACYDAFGRALIGKKNTSVDAAEITDDLTAWHYSEEKLQTHFKCQARDCKAETDILGEYGFCPRCGRTNASVLFFKRMTELLARWQETEEKIADRGKRQEDWEKLTVDSLAAFEALAKHLRAKLLTFPMTPRRRKQVLELSFQRPLDADDLLMQWFDIGLLRWRGDKLTPPRQVSESERPFIAKMVQRRHILMHNGGIVDEEYLARSGDDSVRLNERIRVASNEAKRFIEDCQQMGANLIANVENGFAEE